MVRIPPGWLTPIRSPEILQVIKPKKPIPEFRNEHEERAFWATHDATEHLDWSKAERAVFPNLRPSTRTISLRLPESLLAALKTQARKRDVPYPSLLKILLAEKLEEEMRPRPTRQAEARGRKS